jgi:hypothetical protein
MNSARSAGEFGVRRLAATFSPRELARGPLGLGRSSGPACCSRRAGKGAARLGGPHSKAGALQESRGVLCAIGLTAQFTAWRSPELTS